jgi:hypothetical protein
VLVLWVSDEVHGYVFDHGHVLRPEAGTQAGEVVVEDDVEHQWRRLWIPQWARTAAANVSGLSLADER